MTNQTQNPDEYNGWTNFETWACALHLDNTQATQETIRNTAKAMKSDGEGVYYFADWLKKLVENGFDVFWCGEGYEMLNDLMTSEDIKRMAQDVGSVHRVNWTEIAANIWEEE